MIQVQSLSKSFNSPQGKKIAVKGVSFNVEPGDILGFLGPNAAGKSTTMRMMTGFILPDTGTVKFGGFDILNDKIECQKRIGYVPENAPIYNDMTVNEFLKFCLQVRNQNTDQDKRLNEVIKACFIDTVLDEKIENLSKGYKRRVSIAQALLHDPDYLILDEPTDGLDPNQKHQIRELLKSQAKNNKTIVISTHILEEVEALCNKVVLIAEGEVKFMGTVEEFRAQSSQKKLDEVFRNLTRMTKEAIHA